MRFAGAWFRNEVRITKVCASQHRHDNGLQAPANIGVYNVCWPEYSLRR